jgi:polyphosphate kinase 2
MSQQTPGGLTILDMEDHPPYDTPLNRKEYEHELRSLQVELLKMQRWVKQSAAKVVVLFEGRDAAGKGGAIRRFMENLNPRGARIVALTKPNETERAQWYFQRYVQQLPTGGEVVFFDRSWYNRAGVERVMGFCTPQEYSEFFRQAPGFERSLVQSGLHLTKLWFTVSQKEQRKRFDERQNDPLRQWKLSDIDLMSIDKYEDYTRARDALLFYTDHHDAPWTVVNSNEKRRARTEAIRYVLHTLPYDHKDTSIARPPDPMVVQPASSVMLIPQGPA